MWVAAIPDDAVLLVLVESEMNVGPEKRPGLRAALGDAPANSAGDRIRRAGVVSLLVTEKRIDVARGGETDAQDQRILRGVLQFIQQRRIEAAFHAHMA